MTAFGERFLQGRNNYTAVNVCFQFGSMDYAEGMLIALTKCNIKPQTQLRISFLLSAFILVNVLKENEHLNAISRVQDIQSDKKLRPS